MEINLETLFQKQYDLDKTIQEKHQVTYQDTLIKRILALLVELGECLNETRSFKFWSYKKPSPNEVILEEYVDALHFYLSLGLCLNIDKFVYEYNLISEDINLVFLKVYQDVITFSKTLKKEDYIKAFESFLSASLTLNFQKEDIINSYNNKLEINYQRQENNY